MVRASLSYTCAPATLNLEGPHRSNETYSVTSARDLHLIMHYCALGVRTCLLVTTDRVVVNHAKLRTAGHRSPDHSCIMRLSNMTVIRACLWGAFHFFIRGARQQACDAAPHKQLPAVQATRLEPDAGSMRIDAE